MMPIKNIVVLMLENRSFDHMVGYLRSPGYPIDGPTGSELNYPDPLTRRQTPVPIGNDAPYVPDLDPSPGHEFGNVAVQLYGADPPPQPSIGTNVGFVADYLAVAGATNAGNVMRCFADGKLPALQTLAREFAICDHWFSPMPGPTWPNRFFAHCATSGGFIDNNLRDYPMRTIYQNLSDQNVNWRIYYHDFPQSLALSNQRQYFLRKYELFDQAFVRDCQNGLLPQYSFIEARYFNEGSSRANDQHPDHGVLNGDLLIAQVYEAVRSSPQWPQTLLVVTWDEHGGFYDHVPPRAAPPPDDATQSFDFKSYGVRVPAIVVSAFTAKGAIDDAVYDHTSILATAKELFSLPSFLTRRDAAANTLRSLCSLKAIRSDAPMTLPRPEEMSLTASIAAQTDDGAPNDLQVALLALARHLDPAVAPVAELAPPPQTEGTVAEEARAHLAAFAAAARNA